MLDMAEKWISRISSKSKIEYFDICYDELGQFLSEKSINKHILSEFSQTESKNLFAYHDNLGEDFAGQYTDFTEKFQTYNPADNMRTLRVLVQIALEKVCEHNNIMPEKETDRTIIKLARNLVNNQAIEENTMPWFSVFSDVANRSAHGNYPSKEDLADELKKRQYNICIDVGIWAIFMLDETINTYNSE